MKIDMPVQDETILVPVTPFTGVWIENPPSPSPSPSVSVTPFTGVWIENG